uniref:Uncharacterized protein n=1 Tax=Rhizophora mucronata TaxID=61149 RepID=A0A2P2NBV8_RHIMU
MGLITEVSREADSLLLWIEAVCPLLVSSNLSIDFRAPISKW